MHTFSNGAAPSTAQRNAGPAERRADRRIGVIEAGLPPPELAGRFPDYPRMVACWLGPAMPNVQFTPIRVARGEALPAPGVFDGYVITGSRYGAYDALTWIAELEALVLAAGRAGVPVFGICFGHQVMAQAYGARVAKSARGWGCGAQTYRLEGLAGRPVYHVFHQDQVEEVPVGATLIGGNDFCPIGALRYQSPALSVQFHPEFEGDYLAALLDVRAGVVVPADLADAARASLATAPDNAALARWAAAFFHAHWAGVEPEPASTAASASAVPTA